MDSHFLASILSPLIGAVLTGAGVLWVQNQTNARSDGATKAASDAALKQMQGELDDLDEQFSREREERQKVEERIFNKLEEIAREARSLAGQHTCVQTATLAELRLRTEHNATELQTQRQRLRELADRITEAVVLLHERTGRRPTETANPTQAPAA
jgi:hypothetical protein